MDISDEILAAIKAECTCLTADDTDDVAKKYIAKALRIISVLTCWGDDECSTLLLSERRDVIKVDVDYCKCFGCVVREQPFFNKNVTVTSAKIIRVTNHVSSAPISTTDIYNADLGEFILNLDQDITFEDGSTENICRQCNCCEAEYQLVIDYTAGYTEIPHCIIDLVCRIIGFIKLSANGCETAQEICFIEDKVAFGSQVIEKSNSLETVKFSVPDDKILNATIKLIQHYQILELDKISACRRAGAWGVVV